MNDLQDIFFKTIEEKCHGIYKKKAYFHSLQVSILCQKLALEKNLNIEIAGIMGLFHDYSQFINHSSFHHAFISSQMVKDILKEQHIQDDDIQIITHAIACHSNKDTIDDEYSEILKDADVLVQYLNEPDCLFKESYQKRLNKYLSQ